MYSECNSICFVHPAGLLESCSFSSYPITHQFQAATSLFSSSPRPSLPSLAGCRGIGCRRRRSGRACILSPCPIHRSGYGRGTFTMTRLTLLYLSLIRFEYFVELVFVHRYVRASTGAPDLENVFLVSLETPLQLLAHDCWLHFF